MRFKTFQKDPKRLKAFHWVKRIQRGFKGLAGLRRELPRGFRGLQRRFKVLQSISVGIAEVLGGLAGLMRALQENFKRVSGVLHRRCKSFQDV